MKKFFRLLRHGLILAAAPLLFGSPDNGFVSLFNGKNLDGWDGNPKFWSVQNGLITGLVSVAGPLPYNQFLIWRGGRPRDFELRAVLRESGNNSGLQYRSREMPKVGPWSMSGYQCDVNSPIASNGKLYEELRRTTVAENGQSIVVDPAGNRWLTAQRPPVVVDVTAWNEFTVIARGNHLIHKINGQVTIDVIDCDPLYRALDGLLGIQLHHGPSMMIQVKSIELKELPPEPEIAFGPDVLPAGAAKIAWPRTTPPRPQSATP